MNNFFDRLANEGDIYGLNFPFFFWRFAAEWKHSLLSYAPLLCAMASASMRRRLACSTTIKFVLGSIESCGYYTCPVSNTPSMSSRTAPSSTTCSKFGHALHTHAWWLHRAQWRSQYVHRRSNCGSTALYALDERIEFGVWCDGDFRPIYSLFQIVILWSNDGPLVKSPYDGTQNTSHS